MDEIGEGRCVERLRRGLSAELLDGGGDHLESGGEGSGDGEAVQLDEMGEESLDEVERDGIGGSCAETEENGEETGGGGGGRGEGDEIGEGAGELEVGETEEEEVEKRGRDFG